MNDPDDWLIPDDPARTAGPGELPSDAQYVDRLDEEPPEDYGECFRGNEAESWQAEIMAKIQRELK